MWLGRWLRCGVWATGSTSSSELWAGHVLALLWPSVRRILRKESRPEPSRGS